MKKISILASMVLGLAALSQAQIEGMGWDNGTSEVVGRIGLGGFNHLEVGVGMTYDASLPSNTDTQKDLALNLSASVRYLLALHSWEKFTGYLHVGGYFVDDNKGGPIFVSPSGSVGNRASLALVAGYQPEIVLMNHLAVSTLFGVTLPIMPDLKIGIIGQGVSIVNGANFRILF